MAGSSGDRHGWGLRLDAPQHPSPPPGVVPWGSLGVLATSGEEPAQNYFEFREGCYSLHFDSFSF